jgi:hypothetical protein
MNVSDLMRREVVTLGPRTASTWRSESDCLVHLAHRLDVAETKKSLPELGPAAD